MADERTFGIDIAGRPFETRSKDTVKQLKGEISPAQMRIEERHKELLELDERAARAGISRARREKLATMRPVDARQLVEEAERRK